MSIPKIKLPYYPLKVPSTDTLIHFRPYVVKEEKALLMLNETDDLTNSDVITVVSDLLEAVIKEDIDVSKLTNFDLDYIFAHIRAKSVGEEIKVSVQLDCPGNQKGCPERQDGTINIEKDVYVKREDEHSQTIDLSSGVVLTMRWPTIGDAQSGAFNEVTSIDDGLKVFATLMESITYPDNFISAADYTLEERIEWLGDLTDKDFTKLMDFTNTAPKTISEVTATCPKCGTETTKTATGLLGFFV